jgi:hypothetical protein
LFTDIKRSRAAARHPTVTFRGSYTMPEPGLPGGPPDSVLTWQQAVRETIAGGLLLGTD